MIKNSYKHGFAWGKRTINKQFHEYGITGLRICDKSAQTCRHYAENKSIKKTKTGKPLTSSLRNYYRGIADGMLDGYNKL